MTANEAMAVLRAAAQLSYRERRVVLMRAGLSHTNARPLDRDEVASYFGITAGRCEQVEMQALKKVAQLVAEREGTDGA